MQKSIHSPEYGKVLTLLVAMRKRAGMTQRDLARKLGREHSFVWRIERGERRLDLIEFFWVCRAMDRDAAALYHGLIDELLATAPKADSYGTLKAADKGAGYGKRKKP